MKTLKFFVFLFAFIATINVPAKPLKNRTQTKPITKTEAQIINQTNRERKTYKGTFGNGIAEYTYYFVNDHRVYDGYFHYKHYFKSEYQYINKKLEGHFKDGKRDGNWKIIYSEDEDGPDSIVANYNNGILNGDFFIHTCDRKFGFKKEERFEGPFIWANNISGQFNRGMISGPISFSMICYEDIEKPGGLKRGIYSTKGNTAIISRPSGPSGECVGSWEILKSEFENDKILAPKHYCSVKFDDKGNLLIYDNERGRYFYYSGSGGIMDFFISIINAKRIIETHINNTVIF